ncbi:polycystin-2 domain protein, partial [Opisthorchis viverrini]
MLTRIKDLEQECRRLRQELENSEFRDSVYANSQQGVDSSDEDFEESLASRKRFSRREMSHVLLERNYYKEQLLELQDTVRWTEMLRAEQRNRAETLRFRRRSRIWDIFAKLFTPSKRRDSDGPWTTEQRTPSAFPAESATGVGQTFAYRPTHGCTTGPKGAVPLTFSDTRITPTIQKRFSLDLDSTRERSIHSNDWITVRQPHITECLEYHGLRAHQPSVCYIRPVCENIAGFKGSMSNLIWVCSVPVGVPHSGPSGNSEGGPNSNIHSLITIVDVNNPKQNVDSFAITVSTVLCMTAIPSSDPETQMHLQDINQHWLSVPLDLSEELLSMGRRMNSHESQVSRHKHDGAVRFFTAVEGGDPDLNSQDCAVNNSEQPIDQIAPPLRKSTSWSPLPLSPNNQPQKRLVLSGGRGYACVDDAFQTQSKSMESPDHSDSLAALGDAIQLPLEELFDPQPTASPEQTGSTSETKKHARKHPGRQRNVIRSIWATRQTVNVSDRRIFAKTSLRELVIYLIFVMLALLIALLMLNSASYFYYTSVFNLVVGPYQENSTVKAVDLYGEIKDLDDIWKYIQAQIFGALFPDTWYNRRNVSFNEKEFIGYDNKMLGVPRLRQVRVTSTACDVLGVMNNVEYVCYPPYSASTEGKKPMQPQGGVIPNHTKNAWRYQTAGQLGSAAVAAQYGAYPGSGYVQDLSRSRNTSEEIIQELFEGRWIDEASRVLFLDFTIYNANINMFVIVKLIFELPVTGGVFVSSEFQPAKLVRYLTATDYFVMACEIMYLMFILYYIVEEILEIRKQGFHYFLGVWNILDIVVILLSIICAGFTIYCTSTAYEVMTNMLKDINAHPHFDQLSYWYGHWVRATALCVFFVVIKIFKYVNFDRSLGQLTKTLGTAAFDMIGFMIMFCIVFFAFAQLGYLAFGTSIEGYRSFTQACYTLFRIMVGDIDFVALRRANFFLGPLFFVVFIFFAVFVLLNMFLAIVNDAYANVKEDLVKQKTQLKLKDMVKKSAKEMIKRMRKKSSKTLVQILRSTGLFGREVIPFEDFRAALKCHGYGDTEITATFVKYDTDGDNCLNMKEQRQLEDDIEIGARTTLKQQEEDEGHGTDEEGEQDVNADPDAVEYVDPDDFVELVERVEALEASLLELLSHSDELLAVLEQVELAKRAHRKNLMEMMGNM